MFHHVKRGLRSRGIQSQAFAATALRASATALQKRLKGPLVLDNLDASLCVSVGGQVLTARQLWNSSCVARGSQHARQSQGVCLVGGAKAIQHIWREYQVQPNVVYVPSTEQVLPAWCLEDHLPSFVVRCPPVSIKKHLLSAEYSDGYAAEFPWHPSQLCPAHTLFPTDSEVDKDTAAEARRRIVSMLVLVGLRIPSNVGMLLRAAVDLGYESVLLVNCVDPFQEKVIRASQGRVYSPRLHLFEAPDAASCVSLLSGIALQHRLLPLLAVPSQEAEQAFDVAMRFHANNAHSRELAGATGAVCTAGTALAGKGAAGGTVALGPMLVLGSESRGLRELEGGAWSTPYQLLTLPLPNAAVDSYNVAVAGAILLDLFRPGARAPFSRALPQAGGPQPPPSNACQCQFEARGRENTLGRKNGLAIAGKTRATFSNVSTHLPQAMKITQRKAKVLVMCADDILP